MTMDLYDLTGLTAQHALQMRQQIGAADTPVMAQTASKETMLAALRAAEIDLLMTFRLVPRVEVDSRALCGVWTLNELAGHLADWDRYFLYWLGLLRGNAPQTMLWDDDGDLFNHALQMQRQGDRWEKTWVDFRTNRTALHDAFAKVPTEDFIRQQPSNEHVAYPTIYHCAWSALEHYLDNAAGVRRALQLSLPSELLHFYGPYTQSMGGARDNLRAAH